MDIKDEVPNVRFCIEHRFIPLLGTFDRGGKTMAKMCSRTPY